MTTPLRKRLLSCGLVPLLTLAGASQLAAQDPRDALVARAFNEFDAARRLQLLRNALNPTAGPPQGAWPIGVQLLAQTLIEDGQDSAAGVWLRWAVRLAPDLQPDTVQFLPDLVSAYRSAREFVLRTRSPADSSVSTTWLWPAPQGEHREGGIQVASSVLPLRVEVIGTGVIGPGGRVPLAPGSYDIAVSAAGHDSLRVTREVLPGVTTVLEFRPRALIAQAIPAPETRTPIRPPIEETAAPAKRRFPVVWAVVGGVAAAGIVAALAGGGGGGGDGSGTTTSTPTTGSIIVAFPNP